MKDKYFTSNKTLMMADLFREGDVVSPSYGNLLGVRGVVSDVGVNVTIEFPRPVVKYRGRRPRSKWAYDPSNVRLIAFAWSRLSGGER